MKRSVLGVMTAGLVAVISACTTSPADDGTATDDAPAATEPPRVLTSRDGVVVLVAGDRQGGLDARVAGTLEVGAGGCLYLTRGAVSRLLVWPVGTAPLDDGRQGVNVPGLGDVLVGEAIDDGGGGVTDTLGSPVYPPIPSECDARSVVALNQTER